MVKKSKGQSNRPQERPFKPEPPTSDSERLQSALQALRATAHAREDFCNATDWHRKQTAFRNFLSNGVSVTFLVQGLGHGRAAEFAEWWEPIRKSMQGDPVYRFFWDSRTDSIKRVAPVLGFKSRFTIPEGVVRVFPAPWIGDNLEPFIVGAAEDGERVLFKPDWWRYTVKGMPAEYEEHPLELLMQRYVCALEVIVKRAVVRFGPHVSFQDP